MIIAHVHWMKVGNEKVFELENCEANMKTLSAEWKVVLHKSKKLKKSVVKEVKLI